jgi:hypothetical protein
MTDPNANAAFLALVENVRKQLEDWEEQSR